MLRNRCVATHWRVAGPYQVCRRVLVTFLAIPAADNSGFPALGPFFSETTSMMAEIGGFRTEDLFF